ncbi:MAG: SDR family NAD(P)-dependent oxidoreductase [Bacteroidales bacterium]|nr:SDR family NAD(P)-dependent oxidoreductase [Bacteroidales bacterium]
MKKVALITGASSGIGYETAITLGSNGYYIIALARREHRLIELKEKLKNLTLIHIIKCDVRDYNALKDEVQNIPEQFRPIDVLINNAGLALGLEPIQNVTYENWNIMIDTNIKGVLNITNLVLPLMKDSKIKHIINIGSIAAKEVYPNGNVYCATKSAIDALSKAMRIDLLNDGFKVSVVHPGMTETEFSIVRFNNDYEKAKKVYNGIIPLTGKDIALVIQAILSLPSHVCVNEILITPSAQATATVIKRETNT